MSDSTGVRPLPGAASPGGADATEFPGAFWHAGVAAPGDGRAPLSLILQPWSFSLASTPRHDSIFAGNVTRPRVAVTRGRGVKMTHTVDVLSLNRCKRCQTVAGIFRSCASGFSFKSSNTRVKLLSRSTMSAAFTTSAAERQRIHSKRDNVVSRSWLTSSESAPSITATI